MEKELVDTVLEKNFIELNEKERSDLKEWCASEEEFDQLKMVFKGVEQLKVSQKITPSFETKRSLDDLFVQQHSKVPGTIWYNTILIAIYPTDKPLVRRPVFQLAAVALIVILAYPFIGANDIMNKKSEIAKVESSEKTPDFKTEESSALSTEQDKTLVQSEVKNEVNYENQIPFEMPVDVVASAEISGFESSFSAMATRKDVDLPVSTHPDGIFIGASAVTYSQPASSEPAIFDLLTTTF